jgi:hypothetical protein
MKLLAELVERVDELVVAAWLDTRTGRVLVQRPIEVDPFAAAAIEVAAELLMSPERPARLVLLSADHVHILHRTTDQAHRAVAVVCRRSANLGMMVAIVRSLTDARTRPDDRGATAASQARYSSTPTTGTDGDDNHPTVGEV